MYSVENNLSLTSIKSNFTLEYKSEGQLSPLELAFRVDGSFERHKVCLVGNGKTQLDPFAQF